MRTLIQILIVICRSWNEWIHCSKMWHIFILGPDLSKRGMTAKMGIGNLDPDPVGDQGTVRIQEIERIPDPVLDRAVLWKMETKNQYSNIFCKKNNNKIITSEFWLRDEKKGLRFFHLYFSLLPSHTKRELLLKSYSNNKSPIIKA